MVILEKPYVSPELKRYLADSGTPVLKNETALEAAEEYGLNLVDSEAFRVLLKSGRRLYTTSENAIDWIYRYADDPVLLDSISLMKDKTAFRRRLKKLYPDFFFSETTLEELEKIEVASLKMPCILKPAVGFFSVGVYTISSAEDWGKALKEIDSQFQNWNEQFPETVVAVKKFIIEEYIFGEEYALDAYFDENGDAVILNIMKHDFSGAEDVSDRLYYTGKEIVDTMLLRLTGYLNEMNEILCVRNFPAHIELRINDDRIIPIECNPMRFAGWCTTDLAGFAFGVNTVEYYLNNKKPDWDALFTEKEGLLYSMIILNKPVNCDAMKAFDYEALIGRFNKVLCLRKLDYTVHPVFGFLFTETKTVERAELDAIIRSDLTEFMYREEPLCYIVGAGSFEETMIMKKPGDYLIAADGGYTHLKKIGLRPDLLLGDFDSLKLIPEGENILRLPQEKDDTDMYYAVNRALELDYHTVVIYGGLGGRLDHTIANMQTLAHIAACGAKGYLVGGGTVITALRNGIMSFGSKQRGVISVFCSGDMARGVYLTGLKYPLHDATLTNRKPLGVSNEFTGIESSVEVRDGTVFILWSEEKFSVR